jgi:hypothetical protein
VEQLVIAAAADKFGWCVEEREKEILYKRWWWWWWE